MRVAVHVHPRARRARLSWDGTTLQLWVTEPPVEGAANEAVVTAVARWAGVARSRVRIASGETSRHKLCVVEEIEAPPPADTLF